MTTPGYAESYDLPAERLVDHPEPDTQTDHDCVCGTTLEARPAAWSTTLDVVCPSCGRGGHIDDQGEKHGPAFIQL